VYVEEAGMGTGSKEIVRYGSEFVIEFHSLLPSFLPSLG
jgi:hypothetical protein